MAACIVASQGGAGHAGAVRNPPAYAAKIDPIFQGFDRTSPGCAVGVQQAGAPVFAKGYGMADLEHGVPITPASMFYMASVSKQFTALTVLTLADQNKLKLSDPVRKYIPELPDYTDKITLYHLLTHSSGVRDYLQLGALGGLPSEYVYTEENALKMIARQRALNFTPGSDFLYSNSGYVLLAIVVRRITGESLDQVARRALFRPLGMRHTLFQFDHAALVAGKAFGYQKGGGPDHGETWRADNSSLDLAGDGGLYSSVDDMFHWMRNLETPNVGAADLRLMQQPATLSGAKTTDYGMGLETSTVRGLRVVQHGGALAGYRTEDMWFPDQKLAVVVLCNAASANPLPLASKVAEVYLGPKLQPLPKSAALPMGGAGIALDAAAAQGLPGAYFNPEGGLAKLSVKDRRLYEAGEDEPLVQILPNQFVEEDEPTGNRLIVHDPAQGFDLTSPGRPTLHFDRLVMASLTEESREAFVGAYDSPELDTRWHLMPTDGGMSVVRRDGSTVKLLAVAGDRMFMDGKELVFQRDGSGRVTGFVLNAGRVRGIEMKKISSKASP